MASQEQQQEENFPQSQPHPPQNEQNQQYPLAQIPAQSYPQQQGQDYPKQQEMQPPPYSGPAQTTQPVSYSPYAQQPQVVQPTQVHRNTTVVVTGGAVAVSIFFVYGIVKEIYPPHDINLAKFTRAVRYLNFLFFIYLKYFSLFVQPVRW